MDERGGEEDEKGEGNEEKKKEKHFGEIFGRLFAGGVGEGLLVCTFCWVGGEGGERGERKGKRKRNEFDSKTRPFFDLTSIN